MKQKKDDIQIEQAEMRRMILETAREVRNGKAAPGKAKDVSQLAGAYVALRRVEIEAEREANTIDAYPAVRQVLDQRQIKSGLVSLLPTGLVHSMDHDDDLEAA